MMNKSILLLLLTIKSLTNINLGSTTKPRPNMLPGQSRPNFIPGQNQRTDIAQMIRNMGSEVCPHTDFCYTNASEAVYNETRDPCCSDCSCNDDCWKTRRCCPDKEGIRVQRSNLTCKETITKQRKYDQSSLYDGYNFGIRMYFIIDQCQDENTEERLREKCSGENKTDIDDYRWVSDETTGQIFQNRHCALCHGVKNWWSWNIQITCRLILEVNAINFTEVIHSKKCELLNKVPETHAEMVARFRCYIPSITYCNQTGLWRQFDRSINEACRSFTQIYFPFDRHRTVYKNVFCYICNSEDGFPTIHLCRNRDHDGKGPNSFSALINIEEIKAEPPDNADCRVDELNDVYLKKCRRLRCPGGSMAFYGQCKQLAMDINRLSVGVVFLLIMLRDQINVTQEWERINTTDTELGKQIYEEMEAVLGLHMCPFCSWYVRTRNSTHGLPDFTVHASFLVTSACQLAMIHDKLRATISRRQLEITSNGQKVMVSVDLGTESLHGGIYRESTTVIFKIGFGATCLNEFPITTICPELELSYSEVTSQINGKAQEYLLNLFEDFENVDNGTSVYVCAEDYFMIMSHASAAGNQKSLEVLYALGLVAFTALSYL